MITYINDIVDQIVSILKTLIGVDSPGQIIFTIVVTIIPFLQDRLKKLFILYNRVVDKKDGKYIVCAITRATNDETVISKVRECVPFIVEMLMVFAIWLISLLACWLVRVSIDIYGVCDGKETFLLLIWGCIFSCIYILKSKDFRNHVLKNYLLPIWDCIYVSILEIFEICLCSIGIFVILLHMMPAGNRLYISIVIVCLVDVVRWIRFYQKILNCSYYNNTLMKVSRWCRYVVVVSSIAYALCAAFMNKDFTMVGSVAGYLWIILSYGEGIYFLNANLKNRVVYNVMKKNGEVCEVSETIYQLERGLIKYKTLDREIKIELVDEIREITYVLSAYKQPKDAECLYVSCLFDDDTKESFYSYCHIHKDWMRFCKNEVGYSKYYIVNVRRIKQIIEYEY